MAARPLAVARGKPLRILIVSPLFVPRASAEAISGGNLALALLEEGADLVVLSDANRLIAPETMLDESELWRPLRGIAEAVESRWGAATLYHDVRYRLYGSSASWVHAVVRRARALHREKPFDLVCSRSLPRLAHVAGYWCSRALDVPWAANINDPWDARYIPENKGAKMSWMHALSSDYWLHKTLREADVLTYPTRRLGAYVARIAGIDRLGDELPHVARVVETTETHREFRLVHAGNVGRSFGRSADALLQGLADFLTARPDARPVARLVFLGSEDTTTRQAAERLGLGPNVRSSGWVCYEKCLQWIASASACVLVEPEMDEGFCLRAKFVDYVAARKPVLALSPGVGTVADVVEQGGILRVDPNDADGAARAIGELYDDWKRGTLDARRPSEKLVRTFDATEVARNFLALVERARERSQKSQKPQQSQKLTSSTS